VRVEQITMTPTAIRRIAGDVPAFQPAAVGTGGANTPYADLFAAAGARYQISPSLLAAVAKVESDFNPNAVSSAGAEGLMQIMPSTAAGLGVNPLDPAQAVDGAARMLAGAISRFGSIPLALAAYNAGAGAVEQYGGIPPYPETQSYVQKVLAIAEGGNA
jgi:soluble lytic murein transglycosylase-like protein